MAFFSPYDLRDLLVTINGTSLLVESLQLSHKLNEARVCSFVTRDANASGLCTLGAKVIVRLGKEQIRPAAGRSPNNPIVTFEGIIKTINPQEDIYTVTAFDYVTLLATSEQVDFSDAQYYKGWDAVAVIKDVIDVADVGIDTTAMIETSGILVKDDWGIYDWKTRKAFIDGIIQNMEHTLSDNFHDPFDPITFKYGILDGTQMRVFSPTIKGAIKNPIMKLTNFENTAIVASTDLSKMVNSCTVVSSLDSTIKDTYENKHSIKNHGVQSALLSLPLPRKADCYHTAFAYVEARKDPTITYNIELPSFLWFDLGNLVELEVPTLRSGEILPIVGYNIRMGDSITTTLTMGDESLTTSQIIKELIN